MEAGRSPTSPLKPRSAFLPLLPCVHSPKDLVFLSYHIPSHRPWVHVWHQKICLSSQIKICFATSDAAQLGCQVVIHALYDRDQKPLDCLSSPMQHAQERCLSLSSSSPPGTCALYIQVCERQPTHSLFAMGSCVCIFLACHLVFHT